MSEEEKKSEEVKKEAEEGKDGFAPKEVSEEEKQLAEAVQRMKVKPQPLHMKKFPLSPTPHNTPVSSSGDLSPKVEPPVLESEEEGEGGVILGEDVLKALNPEVRRRVIGLKGIQKRYSDLKKNYDEELRALDLKYEKLYKPLYEARRDIVSGAKEPEEGDVKEGANQKEGEAVKEVETIELGNEEPEGIPNFWRDVLEKSGQYQISEKDLEILSYLKDITYEEFEKGNGFKLYFHFDDNPYFHENVLEKTYLVSSGERPVLEKVEGCKIRWKDPKKNPTISQVKKRKGKKTRVETVPIDSFFNFFDPPDIESLEEAGEEAEEIEEEAERDLEFGEFLRDEVVPHAVEFFTGEYEGLEGLVNLHGLEELEEEGDESEEEDINEAVKRHGKRFQQVRPQHATQHHHQHHNMPATSVKGEAQPPSGANQQSTAPKPPTKQEKPECKNQ